MTAAPGRAEALAATHAWFEVNSGWAPPDPETLLDWAAEDGGRAPDDCWVSRHGTCAHGLASWQVVLDALAEGDAEVAAGAERRRGRPGTVGRR